MRRAPNSIGFLLGVALFCALSCQGNSGPETQFLPGLVTFGHEVRSFRPCGSEEDLWAIDSSGVLWELHQELAPGAEPYEEVFAAVEGFLGPPQEDGFGADYRGTLRVAEVLYAAGEGFGCDTDWGRFSYRASGNEPFWSLDIKHPTVELHRLGLAKRSWTLKAEERSTDGIRFQGRGSDGATIEIELTRKPCRDSMTGAFSGFTATVRIEGAELLGCGLRGAYQG